MITSNSNVQIKNVIKLMKSSRERQSQGVYLVEGVRMFRELPTSELVKFYLTEECAGVLRSNRYSGIGGSNSVSAVSEYTSWDVHWQEGEDYEYVSDSVMKSMADTKTPQGVIAIVKQKAYTREDMLVPLNCVEVNDTAPTTGDGGNDKKPVNDGRTEMDGQMTDRRCILLLEHLQDPGNLGTILRTAEGAGVSGIIMSVDTADIYNPKVVRATMGSIFRVPFCYVEDVPETVMWLKAQGVRCYAAHLTGTDLYQQDFRGASCFFIGNEGNGLTDALTGLADGKIRIPMAGQVESLNAATAATVLMYEAFRQKL